MIAVTNAVLPLLRRSLEPRVVNVSSHAASLTIFSDPDGPMASLLPSAAYSPSKSALNALTVRYANELRKDGVLVNADGQTAASSARRARSPGDRGRGPRQARRGDGVRRSPAR